MVLEIARIDIRPGSEAAFEAAVTEALPLFEAASGCRTVTLQRGIERSSHYVLMIEWNTIEDHNPGFTQSESFGRWRALVGPHFEAPPQMEHLREVVATG